MRLYNFNIERNPKLYGIHKLYFKLICEQLDVISCELANRYGHIPDIAGIAPLSTIYRIDAPDRRFAESGGCLYYVFSSGRGGVAGHRLPSKSATHIYISLDSNSFSFIFVHNYGVYECPMIIMSEERFNTEDISQRTYLEF